MPNRAPSPDQVRAALDELLGWSEILRSPQLAKFLKHIVEIKLRGGEAGIKAYSIAVDVLGRPASFDPQADPIVRVQARRLRGLLQEFYRQGLGRTGVEITLPVGRYVPEFGFVGIDDEAEPAQPEPDVSSPADSPLSGAPLSRRFWTQVIASISLVLVLGLLLFGLQVLRPLQPASGGVDLPQEPVVYLSAFTNMTGIASFDGFASRLSDRLSSILAQYEDIEVGFVEPGKSMDKADGSFLLSGTVAGAPSRLEVTAVLTNVATGATVWNRSFSQPTPLPNDEAVVIAAARKIMREIGPFRGPVHVQGRRWLDENMPQIPAVNGYVCLLTYRLAREFANPAAIAKAIDCHERLLEQQPDRPLALAAEAWLEGRVIFNGAAPADRLDLALARPAELAERARQLAPESSFAHEQLASVQNLQGNLATAQRHYAIALGFEPLNTDARANYAITLARANDWAGASQQAQFAIADTPYPSPWYHYLPSLIALRDGRLHQAIEQGRIAAQGGEIGAIVALAAGGLAGDQQAITDFRARVLSTESLRRHGILPWLGIRIRDEALLARIADGLRAGGVPDTALTAEF